LSAKTIIERLDEPNDLTLTENPVGNHEGKFADIAMRVLHVQKLFPKSHNDDPFLKKYSNLPGEDDGRREEEVVKISSSIADVGSKETFAKKTPGFINIDPFGNWYLLWLFIVSLGVAYNYWTIILRISFVEGMDRHYRGLFVLDYITDLIFLLDIYTQSRTGHMENGELVFDILKTRYHYMKTYGFWLDCLSIIPLDLLYFIFGVNPVFRLARLFKLHRFVSFYERIQVVTNRPNLLNLAVLLHHVFLIIHWVACAYFLVSKSMGYGSEPWVYPVLEGEWAEVP
jgi:hypothetical protein